MRKILLINGFRMSFVRGATLTLLLIFLAGFSYGASLFGDQTKNFVIKNKSVQQAIDQILDKSGYYVVYAVDNIKSLGNVSAEYNNITIEEALKNILSSKGLTFTVKDNNVVIKKESVSAQQPKGITVKGRVIEKIGKKPIAGATIIVVGTNKGAITDEKGQFTFNGNAGEVMEITYMGMKPQTITISPSTKEYVVEMEHDAVAVDDVVVTGIFKKAKESYTGAITSVSAKELKMYKSQNILTTLKNIDPSLNVVSNNSYGSDPNRLPEVNIRGNSSLPTSVKELNEGARAQLNAPLVIMDGFEISLQKLMDYNDDDIESINILKDASATAIYGSRGANGVIVIITKTPEAGKLKINITAGFNLEMPDLSTYDVMKAEEKLTIEREIGFYSDDKPSEDKRLKELYNDVLKEIARGVETDWLSQPVRTGIGQTYNISLTGGNEEFRWMANARYNTVQGAMKDSDKETFNSSITLSYSLKNVIFRNQISVDINKANNSSYGSFSDYVVMNPYWRTHDEYGDVIPKFYLPGGGTTVGNPLYNSTLDCRDESRYTLLTNNFSIEWNIFESLKLRGALGLSKQFNRGDVFYPQAHTKFENVKAIDTYKRGQYDFSTGEAFNYDGNITLNYSKTFAEKHQVYVGIDYSISQRDDFSYLITSIGYPSERLDFFSNGLGYNENGKPGGSENKSRRIGLTGNANYTYDNRYFADFSYRIDGSSQFGTKNKFAPFWSAGLGWNIHREKFLTGSKAISNLRLRGSIGETGSQQFKSYQALSTLKYYTDKRYGIWNAAELMSLGNEDLKWQTTQQMNAGLEFGIIDNRIKGSFDIYSKTTKDLLSQLDIQLSHGFSSYMENIGEVKNSGFEAMLSAYILRDTKREMFWTITGKIAYNKNEVTELSNAIKRQNEEALKENVEINNLLYEGHATNSIYAVRSMGIDPSTGDEVFLNKNGEIVSTWNPSDKVYMGVAEPKYRGNVSTMVQYKGLSLNLSFGYHFGGKQYNETLMNRVEVTKGDLKFNADRRVYSDRWRKAGDIKFYKGIGSDATKATSRFVMDDNVFELQSANLQYLWSSRGLREKTRLQSVTFGVNMSDMFYFSNIKRERGTDYPFARRISFSVMLAF